MVRGRNAKKGLREKVVVQVCVQCDQPAVIGCRGLCAYHHGQFKYARAQSACGCRTKKQVDDAKEEFDKEQVRLGRILPSRQGKHSKRGENPFRVKTA